MDEIASQPATDKRLGPMERREERVTEAINKVVPQRDELPILSEDAKGISMGDRVVEDLQWQTRLLPLMMRMLVGLTIFFFGASLLQLYLLDRHIKNAPKIAIETQILPLAEVETNSNQHNVPFGNRVDYAKWRTSAILEGHALQRRYYQAGILLISRTWIRYLGFVIGTMLALVGAAFVLGKLREPSSKLDAESSLWKMSVSSASPGIILAVLGTILMLATMASNFEMQLQDAPSYIPQYSNEAPLYVQPPRPLSSEPASSASPQNSPRATSATNSNSEDEGREIREEIRRKLESNKRSSQ